VLVASPSDGERETASQIDGVYLLCEEVAGYSGETLELDNGNFRYWFYSDVGGPERTYPLIGTYVIKEDRLILQHPDIYSSERTLASVNGHSVIWREEGLELWREQKRIHPYAVLIRVPGGRIDDPWANRPSVKLLYDREMIQREEDEYLTRYEDQADPIRSLLRARTARNDPELNAYRSEIKKARTNLNDRILRQLIARMGDENMVESITAESILCDLYESSRLIPENPPFFASKKTFHESLNLLAEAMTEAKDRSALTHTMILFLRVSKIGTIDLPIPEAGIRIRIEARQDGGSSDGSSQIQGSEIRPKDYRWKDEIGTINQACQKWCLAAIGQIQDTPDKRVKSSDSGSDSMAGKRWWPWAAAGLVLMVCFAASLRSWASLRHDRTLGS
jgi:hypothetical protein